MAGSGNSCVHKYGGQLRDSQYHFMMESKTVSEILNTNSIFAQLIAQEDLCCHERFKSFSNVADEDLDHTLDVKLRTYLFQVLLAELC
jgi:Golgi nucleoside diphosphatase